MTFPKQFQMGRIERTANPSYPSGANLDVSHGATTTCLLKYDTMPVGLYHVKCRACGANVNVNVIQNGTVLMPCNMTKADKAALAIPP
jgi:hypothetical protein